jgi:hypothetical protein
MHHYTQESFFVSEWQQADIFMGMHNPLVWKYTPLVYRLQDGSNLLGRTTGSGSRSTVDDRRTATFAGSIDVGNDADVTGSATTGYIKLNGNAYNGWISMDASSLHIGHNTSARNLVLETNSTAALTINGSQTAIFAGRFVYRRWCCALLRFYIPTNSRSCGPYFWLSWML